MTSYDLPQTIMWLIKLNLRVLFAFHECEVTGLSPKLYSIILNSKLS